MKTTAVEGGGGTWKFKPVVIRHVGVQMSRTQPQVVIHVAVSAARDQRPRHVVTSRRYVHVRAVEVVEARLELAPRRAEDRHVPLWRCTEKMYRKNVVLMVFIVVLLFF